MVWPRSPQRGIQAMAHDIEIDLSDLSPPPSVEIRFAQTGPMAAVEFDGNRLRVPLATFHCASIRRDIEQVLAKHELCPQWHLAHKGVDLAGAPVRFVSVARAVDSGWS